MHVCVCVCVVRVAGKEVQSVASTLLFEDESLASDTMTSGSQKCRPGIARTTTSMGNVLTSAGAGGGKSNAVASSLERLSVWLHLGPDKKRQDKNSSRWKHLVGICTCGQRPLQVMQYLSAGKLTLQTEATAETCCLWSGMWHWLRLLSFTQTRGILVKCVRTLRRDEDLLCISRCFMYKASPTRLTTLRLQHTLLKCPVCAASDSFYWINPFSQFIIM